MGNIPTTLDDLADAASGVHDTSGINQVAPTAPQLRFSSPSWYCTRCQMSRDDPVCYSRDCITSPKSNIFALYYWCKTCQEFRTVVMDPLTGYDEDDRRRRLCRYCRDHLSTDGYILDPQRLQENWCSGKVRRCGEGQFRNMFNQAKCHHKAYLQIQSSPKTGSTMGKVICASSCHFQASLC